jgi:hypothetical protein
MGHAMANLAKKIKGVPNCIDCRVSNITGNEELETIAPTPNMLKIPDCAKPVPRWVMDSMEVT